MNFREFQSYPARERFFIIFALLVSFFLCSHYAIIRPISTSLFIQFFGAKLLPYAWLGTVPLNLILVSLYNRFIPKWGSKNLFFGFIVIISIINVFFGLFAKTVPAFTFFYYVWKEIYIMLMFQFIWSVIHSNIKFEKAKFLYGWFFGIGGFGSLLGAFFPGFFATTYGSENLIFWIIPIDLLLLYSYIKMTEYSIGETPQVNREKEGGFLHGIQLIQSSRFLVFALAIVVFMQMSTAIAEFQFNDFLGRTYLETDIRTEYSARISVVLSIVTMVLQFIGAYFLINYIGFRKTHYLVPSLIGASSTLLAFFPVSHLISSAFITCKALDFSVFGVVREMLYIPLKPDEKYRARAVIDVFASRSSKAFGSLLIIGITTFFASHHLTYVNIGIAILWFISVGYGLKEFEKLAPPEEAP